MILGVMVRVSSFRSVGIEGRYTMPKNNHKRPITFEASEDLTECLMIEVAKRIIRSRMMVGEEGNLPNYIISGAKQMADDFLDRVHNAFEQNE